MSAQPVVGRTEELGAVERFLDEPGTSSSALVIEGEAGIGKTTVWRAGVAAAERRGYRVLRAQPAESEEALSFSALADLLVDAYDERRAELPAPQQHGLDVALLRATADDAADSRTAATGLVSILTALAQAGPVVLAIDDVQWLDRASARALEFAARRLPPGVLLLLARRLGIDAEPPLGLRRDGLIRLPIGPLSIAALHHVLQSHRGAAPARPVLVRLEAASGGNPFYALEIARALELRPGAGALDEPLPVPHNLHELVAGRLDALSADAREVVLLAAALSRPTQPALEASLATGRDVAQALEEAEAAGVVVIDSGRVRFAHPLLASAVYGSTSGGRLLALHRHLAQVVTDPEERARHLALSAVEPDEATAGEIELGARGAVRRGAQDAAADLYKAARRLTPPGSGEELARRSIGEATAVLAVGDLSRARALAEEAVGCSPAGSLRAESLFLLSQVAWVDGIDSATTHLEQALVEAGEERRLRGRIHGKLAAVTALDQRAAVEHADAAAKLLDEDEDPGLLAYALVGSLFFGAQIGLGARPELLARALELEERAGPDAQKHPLILVWLQSVDDFEAARERHELEDRWYRERGDEGWRAARQAGQRAKVELRAGNWSLAERLAEEGCATIEQLGGHGPWSNSLMTRAQIDALRGRIERARATLLPIAEEQEHRGSQWFAALALASLGFVELAAGDAAAADAAFVRVEEHLEAVGVACPLPVRSEPDHIEALVALGELDRAQRVLDLFERRARLFPRFWIAATLPRARALVLAAKGEVAGALTELEQAPEIDLLPFELARTLLVRGQLQRRLRQKQRAAASLGRALALFELLGAPHWIGQAQSELARVGLRRGDPDELTASERRIAELAAAGLTNKQVAEAAFVSPKTVEANLARVYRKLGIASRAELGARMSA